MNLIFKINSSVNFGTESSRIDEASPESYDYGLLDAINLLSAKPQSPATLRITPVDESGQEFELEQTTSLWPPSDSMPGRFSSELIIRQPSTDSLQ